MATKMILSAPPEKNYAKLTQTDGFCASSVILQIFKILHALIQFVKYLSV